MKAIISHDVDHLTLSEHYLRDLIVPKYFIRSAIEFFNEKISFNELYERHLDIFRNQWQHLEALAEFNKQHKIPATYFIGVNNGVGLQYSTLHASNWILKLLSWGCEVGVHGIEFETLNLIESEYQSFKSISRLTQFGTRMHYIRTNNDTLANMSKAGYIFDSSEMSFSAPYKIGNMWEFPFQIMDGYIIQKPKQWQNKNLVEACDETKRIIDKALTLNLPYLGIDFHDRYFSNAHATWKNWYMWLINYLLENNIECIDFKKAILELESK